MIRVLLILGLLPGLGAGCAFIEPTTQVKFHPMSGVVEFLDTKDNDIEVNNVTYTDDGDGRSFACESIKVLNQSSPVIEANVAQMMAFVEQQRAANEGITATMAGLATLTQMMAANIEALGVAVERLLQALPAAEIDLNAGGLVGIEGSIKPRSSVSQDISNILNNPNLDEREKALTIFQLGADQAREEQGTTE